MNVVTEEMHSAVLGAYMNRLMTEMRADSDGELDTPSRDEVKFILAAVAPLIAAQERAQAIAIAQSEHSDAAQDIDMATQAGDEMGRRQSEGAAHAAARIAAAIRARGRDMSARPEERVERALDIATMIIVREYFGVDTSANDIAVDAYVSCEALATDILAAVVPLIAAQEREAAIAAAAKALDAYRKWDGEITPERLMKPVTAAIRALPQ